jgi:hypothetical protein
MGRLKNATDDVIRQDVRVCEAHEHNFSYIYKDGFVVNTQKECAARLERLFGDGTWLKKILTIY